MHVAFGHTIIFKQWIHRLTISFRIHLYASGIWYLGRDSAVRYSPRLLHAVNYLRLEMIGGRRIRAEAQMYKGYKNQVLSMSIKISSLSEQVTSNSSLPV